MFSIQPETTNMKSKFSLILSFVIICCAEESPRIFGGNFAKDNQFPHQIAIIYKKQLRCGGSIISFTWCLTAAHCVLKSGKM
jgi:secreted trypsin-like serine protease